MSDIYRLAADLFIWFLEVELFNCTDRVSPEKEGVLATVLQRLCENIHAGRGMSYANATLNHDFTAT